MEFFLWWSNSTQVENLSGFGKGDLQLSGNAYTKCYLEDVYGTVKINFLAISG